MLQAERKPFHLAGGDGGGGGGGFGGGGGGGGGDERFDAVGSGEEAGTRLRIWCC